MKVSFTSKKITAFLLVACMMLSMLPIYTQAQDVSFGIVEETLDSGLTPDTADTPGNSDTITPQPSPAPPLDILQSDFDISGPDGMVPLAAASGSAQGITGSNTIIITLGAGRFAAAIAISHTYFTLGGTGEQTVQGISRESDKVVRLTLSANIQTQDNLTVTADSAAFEAGTSSFGTLTVYHASHAAGTAAASAGTNDIILTLTNGTLKSTQSETFWTLGGASSDNNSIVSVTYIGQREAKITLQNSINVSDTFTLQVSHYAFVNLATASFLSPLTVAITGGSSETNVCQIGETGYTSLENALAAVGSGQSAAIKLLQNMDYTYQIEINNKIVSFDLNDKILNVITNDNYGLYVTNGGKVYLTDSGTGVGEFNLTGSYGGVGVYGSGSEAFVTNATGERCGVDASAGIVTVYGNATATGANNDDDWGVKAVQGSNVTVYGNATGQDFGISSDRSTVTVYGNATGQGGDNSAGVKAGYESTVTVHQDAAGGRYGVSAEAKCTVTIEGDVLCTGHSYGTVYGVLLNTGTGPTSTLRVKGNVTAAGTNAYGAVAQSSWDGAVAQITIDGSISAAKYIMLGSMERTAESGIDSTVKEGYKEYTDTRNTVWVKDSSSVPVAAHTVTASPAALTPTAGEANTITLIIKDSSGNVDTTFTGTHDVTVSGAQPLPGGTGYGSFYSMAIPAGGTLTTRVIFQNGVATPPLSLFKAGAQTILFSITGVTNPSASANLTVVPRSPSTMTLTQDIAAPSVNGGPFATQPKLELKDSYANLCTNDSTTQVTASKSDSGDWTLTGTTTVRAVNGIVAFTNLGAANAGQIAGAKLTFTSDVSSIGSSESRAVTLPPPETTDGVFELDGVPYPTLETALAAIAANGTGSIYLRDNAAAVTPIVIDGKDVTFLLGMYTLTLDTSADESSGALTVKNGGKADFLGSGKFNITGGLCAVRAEGTGSEATVSYAKTTGDSAYTVQAVEGGSVTVEGNVLCSGNGGYALWAVSRGQITAEGSVTCLGSNSCGVYAAGEGSKAIIRGGVAAKDSTSNGVRANNGGTAEITGDITAGKSGVSTYGIAAPASEVTVYGNVTVNSPESEGASAGGYTHILVTGNVTAKGTDSTGVYSNASTVIIGGKVTSDGIGAAAANSGSIRIDGVLTAAGSYVTVAGTVKGAGEYDITDPDSNYRVYKNDGSIISVKKVAAILSPTVVTGAVTGVTSNAASLSGAVTSDGGGEIMDYGFVWGTTMNPTILNGHKVSGTGSSSGFTANLTGLAAGTTYHVRAYAKNSAGTSYGADISFASRPVTPVSYTVTFNLNGGIRTGGGALVQTIPGGGAAIAPTVTRSGYTFTGWDNAFHHVTSNLTVTASWRYNNSENGSGSGSSSGGSATVTPTPAIPDNMPGQPVTISAASLPITLTQNLLENLVNTNVTRLEINGTPISLYFDLNALKEILNQSSSGITIRIAPVTDLSGKAQAIIGNRPVYRITIHTAVDGRTENISSLGSGTAILSIPYSPDINEAGGYLFGVYVDENGEAILIPGSVYDADSGRLLIPAGHFSVYGVGYMDTKIQYKDITDHPAKESIDYILARGLMTGASKKAFSPERFLTRGVLAAALGKLADIEVTEYTESRFTDVKDGGDISPYIEWAYRKGIMKGFGSRFIPNRVVTHEELARILVSYAKATGFTLPAVHEELLYTDTGRIDDTLFNPKRYTTRAEFAAMLHRYIKLTINAALIETDDE